jgi:hypothetical protein
MAYLNLDQNIQLTLGFLKVIRLQLSNPVLFGWNPGAAAENTAARTALRSLGSRAAAAAEAGPLAERLAAEVSGLPGNKFQKFLEAVRRLSLLRGVPQQVKADAVEEVAKRLGLEVGGQGAVSGGRIIIAAKDARTALQVAADGSITFGKARIVGSAIEIVNPSPIRPLLP